MSPTSRESDGAAATPQRRLSARARPASSARQERKPRGGAPRSAGFAGRAEHEVGDEIVAGAVGAVELGLVRQLRTRRSATAPGWDWTMEKAGWLRSASRTRSSVSGPASAPAGEPFVEHQRVALETPVEGVERVLRSGSPRAANCLERRRPVGHVVGLCETGARPRDRRSRFATKGRGDVLAATGVRRWCKSGLRAPAVLGSGRFSGAAPIVFDRGAQALRAAKMASGSTSRPISRATSASPGRASTSARNAG